MLGLLLLLFAAPLAASGFVRDETVRGEIELGFVNGVWADLDSGFQPVRRGGLTIRVASPEHRVTVHRNRLTLSRDGDGPVDASLEVEFQGEGQIVADLVSAGLENRIEDRVTAPRQSVAAWAKVRFERDEGGYLMTVVEAQPKVDLEIRSDLAGRLVAFCRVFEKLPLIPVDCAGIETALSVVTVPLPGPGEQFLIPGERLTAGEKAFFDRFL
jgi:hypothetical protein